MIFSMIPCFYRGERQAEPGLWLLTSWKLGSSSRSVLLVASLLRSGAQQPLAHSQLQPSSFPLSQPAWETAAPPGSVLEPLPYPIHFHYLNYRVTVRVTKAQNKNNFPHTGKAAFNSDKGLTFLMLYKNPLHLSTCFSAMAHGAFWKHKVKKTGKKPRTTRRWNGRKEWFRRGQAGLVMNRHGREKPPLMTGTLFQWATCKRHQEQLPAATRFTCSAGSARRGFPLADRGKCHLQSTNIPQTTLAVTICCTDFGRKSLDESWWHLPGVCFLEDQSQSEGHYSWATSTRWGRTLLFFILVTSYRACRRG